MVFLPVKRLSCSEFFGVNCFSIISYLRVFEDKLEDAVNVLWFGKALQ